LDPHIGVLSDPSANYTSESVLQEMLAIAAEQVDLITSRMLKNSDVFSLTLDESTCNSNLPQLLIYSNQMVAMANDPDLTEPLTRLLACCELSVDVEATLKFAREHLRLDAATMAAYEKKNGIATKSGLNMLYHLFKVSQRPVFRDSLKLIKTGGSAADSTAANTGVRRGFFELLEQLVTRLGGRLPLRNSCLAHRVALALLHAANSVDFIGQKFQPMLEEMYKFISNSAVRHKAMQDAFAGLEMDEVATLGAFFTRWMSHGRVVANMHKGLAGILTGFCSLWIFFYDCANLKAKGLCYQIGSFNFIATVELIFDVFEPIDIYKSNSKRGNNRMLEMWHIIVRAYKK
jgi:hypothetical protein